MMRAESPFLRAREHLDFRVTQCLHFDTTHPCFSKSSPNTCQILGQASTLEKIIGRASYSMHGAKEGA